MKTQFKGTKGKWDSIGDGVVSLQDGLEGNIICEAPFGYNQSLVNWDANAKLISYAPEMLEMLNLLTKIYSADNIEKAKLLIKKATKI